MKISFLFLLILFVLTFQITAQNETSEWTRYSSNNNELGFELPSKSTYFYDKDGFSYSSPYGDVFHFSEMQMMNSAVDDTYFCVEIYKVSNPNAHLNDLADKNGLLTSKVDSGEKNFTVKTGRLDKKFFREKKFLDQVNFETRFVASKSHLYVFTTWNRGKSNLNSERFISSIKLSSTKTADDKAVAITTLKPLTISDIGEDLPKEKAKLLNEDAKSEPKDSDDLNLLYLPFPGLTGEARSRRVSGSVRFLVKYANNGRIEKISVISGLPSGLNRNTFFSTLRIKFLPKISGGKAIAAERIVKFSFNR